MWLCSNGATKVWMKVRWGFFRLPHPDRKNLLPPPPALVSRLFAQASPPSENRRYFQRNCSIFEHVFLIFFSFLFGYVNHVFYQIGLRKVNFCFSGKNFFWNKVFSEWEWLYFANSMTRGKTSDLYSPNSMHKQPHIKKFNSKFIVKRRISVFL